MAEKKLNLNAFLKETDAEKALTATLEEIPEEIPKDIKEANVEKIEEKPRVHLNLSSFTEKQEETLEIKEDDDEKLKVKSEEISSIETTKQVENTEATVEKEEEITSKVNIDDVIDETTPKDDGSEVFENYKSTFDEDDKKLETEVKEITSLQDTLIKEEPKENKIVAPKKKRFLGVILIVIIILAILGALFIFKNQILEIFNKDTTTPPVESIIQIPDEQKDNPPVEQQANENQTGTGIENLSPTEQENLNNYIEQVTENYPELTPKEINTLIRKKIIEIYFKKNIR